MVNNPLHLLVVGIGSVVGLLVAVILRVRDKNDRERIAMVLAGLSTCDRGRIANEVVGTGFDLRPLQTRV
jgi:hypothetical protein